MSRVSNTSRPIMAIFLYLIMAQLTFSQGTSEIKEKLSRNEFAIEYIGHASFLIHSKDHSILLDPFADTIWIGYSFPKGITADAIFSTHPHYDHDGGIFRGISPYWEKEIPLHQDPAKVSVGDFNVFGIKGKHSDPYGKEFRQKNTIWMWEIYGVKMAHWEDNGPITEGLKNHLTGIDILFLPIDDDYHILKKAELEEAIEAINPKIIIPMHYRLADLEEEGKPKDLGGLEQFLSAITDVEYLSSNIKILSRNSIEESSTIIVFEHSPLITKAKNK